MGSKLKAGGIAILAVLAMQAMVASGAQAEFESSSSHTIFTAPQTTTHKITPAPGVGTISCVYAGFSGTSSAKVSEDLTAKPEFGLCKDSFGRMVTIAGGNVAYTFTTDGTVHHTGGHITFTQVASGGGVNCVITVGPQTMNGISYKNLGGTKGIEVTTNVTNMVTTITGGLFACGVKAGEYTSGTYTGVSLLTGKDTAGNPVELNKLP